MAQVSLEGQGTAEVPHCLKEGHPCDCLPLTSPAWSSET